MIPLYLSGRNDTYVRSIPVAIGNTQTMERINLTLVMIFNRLSDIYETDSYNRILP